MRYPALLSPTTFERMRLPMGDEVDVPKSLPAFEAWEGAPPGPSYGGKAILRFQEQPAFAELVILASFTADGWDGAWIDTFGHRYLRSFWPTPQSVQLPPVHETILTDLAKESAKPWDVICWKDDRIVFVEAKRSKKDHVRESQLLFLQNGLAAGLAVSSFLLVEWHIPQSA